MANTAHKTEEEKKEYFDPEDVLDQKIELLTQMILTSKHMIAFTGAGISTSCGIPDYRSGMKTVLPTGPGCWEKLAQTQNKGTYKRVQMTSALPSTTHMALQQLQQVGLLKFLISQNVDGLHRKSGIPPEAMAEVHGNTNLEKCEKCHKEYMRDFKVRNAKKVHDHHTGRKCDDPSCQGKLYDSIINFGENLPEKELNAGFEHSERADLCLVLGSSLRVTPAADMPKKVGQRKQNLVIVNLQKTPLDSLCSLRIYALCDKVIEMLMKKLSIKIPEFILQRRLDILQTAQKLIIKGTDLDGSPFQYIKDVKIKQGPLEKMLKVQPFEIAQQLLKDQPIQLTLSFFSHYNEGQLQMTMQPAIMQNGQQIKNSFLLSYDPSKRQWKNPQQI